MHGNLFEMCQDRYADGYAPNLVVDPKGPEPEKGFGHVVRGGSWAHLPYDLRSTSRGYVSGYGGVGHIGFRVARDF
jgi:formylglycine-generating enzyme required for sulfatase activity